MLASPPGPPSKQISILSPGSVAEAASRFDAVFFWAGSLLMFRVVAEVVHLGGAIRMAPRQTGKRSVRPASRTNETMTFDGSPQN